MAAGPRRLTAVVTLALLLPTAARSQESAACPPSAPVPLALPKLTAAIARGEPAVIVAFGSSSTRGAAASNPAHSYPAILQAELARRLPAAHVAVINRGTDGQDASEELVRIGRDVIAVRPQAVIWQVGANAAMRNVDPESFRVTVVAGVKRLQESGADVLLMDNQRAARILDAPRRAEIEGALETAARLTGAALFRRGGLMDAWRAAGHPYETFTAPDQLHHNDLGYRCLAEALANSMVAAITRGP